MTNTQSSTEILKVDTAGRVRVPKAKQEEILTAYRESGMTGRQFAEYVGVKYPTFMNWLGKARRAGGPQEGRREATGLNWVEAVMEAGTGAEREALSIEIGTCVRMQVGNTRQAGLAGEILRGFVRPC